MSDKDGFMAMPISEDAEWSEEGNIVTVDHRWEVNISSVKNTGRTETVNVSDSKGSKYDHNASWGTCGYKQIEIKKEKIVAGNKEFGRTKGYEIRAYYKGKYVLDNKLDTTISKIGFWTGAAGKTKLGKDIMNQASSRLNPDSVSGVGWLLFIGGKTYERYTQRYEDVSIPDYDILYSSFHN